MQVNIVMKVSQSESTSKSIASGSANLQNKASSRSLKQRNGAYSTRKINIQEEGLDIRDKLMQVEESQFKIQSHRQNSQRKKFSHRYYEDKH